MIKELLNHGEENALSTEWLMTHTGETRRGVVAAASKDRAEGTPVLSSSKGGYYLPDATDPEKALREIHACIRTIEARGRNTLNSLKTLRREARRLESVLSGQMEISSILSESETTDV